jgi:hypothetical protein
LQRSRVVVYCCRGVEDLATAAHGVAVSPSALALGTLGPQSQPNSLQSNWWRWNW